jgi:hypothetical protein
MADINAITHEAQVQGREFYGPTYLNFDALEEYAIPLYKATEGDNFFVIVDSPYDGYYGRKIFVHYSIGPNKNGAVLCPYWMSEGKKPCPICDFMTEQTAAGATWDDIKELKQRVKYLFMVLNFADDAETAGMMLYDAPPTVNKEIINLSKNKLTGEISDLSHFVLTAKEKKAGAERTGKIISFTREGKDQQNTKYGGFATYRLEEALDVEQIEALDAQIKELQKTFPKWEELLVTRDYEGIGAAHFGVSAMSGEDSEDGFVDEPEVVEPEATEPEATEPETAEPETAEPETAEPETAEPETAEPETAEPETAETTKATTTKKKKKIKMKAGAGKAETKAKLAGLRGASKKKTTKKMVRGTKATSKDVSASKQRLRELLGAGNSEE